MFTGEGDVLPAPDGQTGAPAPDTEGTQPDKTQDNQTADNAATAPAQAPESLIGGKFQSQDDLLRAYQEVEREKGRLADTLGTERQRAQELQERTSRYEQALLDRQQQVAVTSEPLPDPEQARWQRVTPFYNQKLAFYQEAFGETHEEEVAKRLAERAAMLDAQAQYDYLKYADEQRDIGIQAARHEMAPVLARQRAANRLATLGIADATPDELLAEAARGLGVDPAVMTASLPQQAQDWLFDTLAKAKALDKRQTGTAAQTGTPNAAAPPQALANVVTSRATPQQPVNTGPGVVPTSASVDRAILELAEDLRSKYFGFMPEEQAKASALEAAKDMYQEALLQQQRGGYGR